MDRHLDVHSYHYNIKHYTAFGELADMVLGDGLVQTMHYTMVEAVRPFKLDTTSISYIYKVFDYLLLLWIGICMYIHTITTSSITQLLVSWLKF